MVHSEARPERSMDVACAGGCPPYLRPGPTLYLSKALLLPQRWQQNWRPSFHRYHGVLSAMLRKSPGRLGQPAVVQAPRYIAVHVGAIQRDVSHGRVDATSFKPRSACWTTNLPGAVLAPRDLGEVLSLLLHITAIQLSLDGISFHFRL